MNRYIITKDITQCCGCSACVAKCPKKCLKMTTDVDGFYVPEMVDEENCVNCGLCSEVCPFENPNTHEQTTEFYAAYSSNDDYIKNSSSGGVFPELAEHFLKNGGKVFGAYMDDCFNLKHVGIVQLSELKKLMRSKYYQSDICQTYAECEQDLMSGREVLFSGTPCQIMGLRNYLGKDYANLYTIDIICHGVPSPLFFREYRYYLERKHKGKLITLNFRDKTEYGWSETMKYSIIKFNGEKKDFFSRYQFSDYLYPFFYGLVTRESCYCCPFATLNRCGDITLGDFFGYQKSRPDLFHEDGLSLVLVNSIKGEKMKNSCALLNRVTFNEVTEQDVRISGNSHLYVPIKRPNQRNDIYNGIREMGIDYMMKKHLAPKLSLRQRIRQLLPDSIVYKLKSILK